jgi:hypothetical protein
MKKFSDTIGNRTRDVPVCSAVPQPLRHRVPPAIAITYISLHYSRLQINSTTALISRSW